MVSTAACFTGEVPFFWGGGVSHLRLSQPMGCRVIVKRYVSMTSNLWLVETYNAEHSLGGQDIQHHSTINKVTIF